MATLVDKLGTKADALKLIIDISESNFEGRRFGSSNLSLPGIQGIGTTANVPVTVLDYTAILAIGGNNTGHLNRTTSTFANKRSITTEERISSPVDRKELINKLVIIFTGIAVAVYFDLDANGDLEFRKNPPVFKLGEGSKSDLMNQSEIYQQRKTYMRENNGQVGTNEQMYATDLLNSGNELSRTKKPLGIFILSAAPWKILPTLYTHGCAEKQQIMLFLKQ